MEQSIVLRTGWLDNDPLRTNITAYLIDGVLIAKQAILKSEYDRSTKNLISSLLLYFPNSSFDKDKNKLTLKTKRTNSQHEKGLRKNLSAFRKLCAKYDRLLKRMLVDLETGDTQKRLLRPINTVDPKNPPPHLIDSANIRFAKERASRFLKQEIEQVSELQTQILKSLPADLFKRRGLFF